MSSATSFFELAETRFADGFECKLHGTRDTIEAAVIASTRRLRLQGFRITAEHAKYRGGQPIVTVRADAIDSTSGGSIGILEFVEAAGGVVWMRIPAFRGSEAANAWKPDHDGLLFAEFLTRLIQEFEKLGFARHVAQGEAARRLATARSQIASANDPESVIGIANILRSALIQVANEVYAPKMRPEDADEPKADDATSRLKYFVDFKLSTISDRYRKALCATIDAVWDVVNALVHRKNATKADAETCVELVEATSAAITRISRTDNDH